MKIIAEPCPSCGGLFRPHEGPVHPYMDSSPACWAAYGEVLAREYSNPELLAVHRLSVDAYAVQHPGGNSRQAIQSVGVHLVRLCLLLERDLSHTLANAAMLKAARFKSEYFWLERPPSLGRITVADVHAASGHVAHGSAATEWARSVWSAWSVHHAVVRQWADAHFVAP